MVISNDIILYDTMNCNAPNPRGGGGGGGGGGGWSFPLYEVCFDRELSVVTENPYHALTSCRDNPGLAHSTLSCAPISVWVIERLCRGQLCRDLGILCRDLGVLYKNVSS